MSIISFAIISFGFFCAWLYGRKTKNFQWREYFAMLAGPAIVLGIHVHKEGVPFILFFCASAILGLLAELGIGITYEKILGEKFWIYQRLPIFGGYVSWLGLPFWGLAGTFFLQIARLVGAI